MGFLVCIKKKRVSKGFICGNALQSLVMATVACKEAAKTIAKEKGICQEEAEKFVVESVKEATKLLY